MNTEITCKCYTRKTKELCGNPAEWITVVWKGSNIYLPGFPSTDGWLTTEAAVCKMHLNNTLKKGKSLEYRTDSLATVMPEKSPFLKENTMDIEGTWDVDPAIKQLPIKGDAIITKGDPIVEDTYTLPQARAAFNKMEDKGHHSIVAVKENGKTVGWVIIPRFVKDAKPLPIIKGIFGEKKGVSCGNCKKTHDTIAEVKECYSNKS